MYENLTTVLHNLAQALMVPVIIVLILLVAYAVFQVGVLVVEWFTERKSYRPMLATLINQVEDAPVEKVSTVISESPLLLRQREALGEVCENRHLPADALYALASKNISKEREFYKARISKVDLVTKLGPMVGLMGTLIPLGPGIVALGTGDTATLAASLLVAFDTTVAGLVAAAVCVVLARFKRKWYAGYMQTLESSMTALLERFELERGEVD